MKLIKQTLPTIDIFLEIRDSRVPLSSFNKDIDNLIKLHNKEKIIIFNKYDLCEQEKTNQVIKELQSLGYITMAISSKQRRFDFFNIIKYSKTIKQNKYQTVGLWMMIGGVPNVGKSNIINNLRVISKNFKNNKVQKSSNKPCLTTYTSGFKISEDPLVFLVDTPGILMPDITNIEMGLNLTLAGSIKPHLTNKKHILEYLIYKIGERGRDIIYKKYNLSTRPQGYEDLLVRVKESFKLQNEDIALSKILKDFQTGFLGRYTLDDVFHKLDRKYQIV